MPKEGETGVRGKQGWGKQGSEWGKQGSGKQGSECTFISQRKPPGSSYLGRAGTSPELDFNDCAEARGAVDMLSLQMQSNVVKFFFGNGLHNECTICITTLYWSFAERQVGRMRLDQ